MPYQSDYITDKPGSFFMADFTDRHRKGERGIWWIEGRMTETGWRIVKGVENATSAERVRRRCGYRGRCPRGGGHGLAGCYSAAGASVAGASAAGAASAAAEDLRERRVRPFFSVFLSLSIFSL